MVIRLAMSMSMRYEKYICVYVHVNIHITHLYHIERSCMHKHLYIIYQMYVPTISIQYIVLDKDVLYKNKNKKNTKFHKLGIGIYPPSIQNG